MSFVISYREAGSERLYVRWYQNGKCWVPRKHGATATQYATKEAAELKAAEMGLPNALVEGR